MIYRTLKTLAFAVCKIMFRLRVYGEKHIPVKGGFILASNHLSYLDPIVVGCATKRRLSYMAKRELFCNAFSRWLFQKIEVFPVKRGVADFSAIREAIRRLEHGSGLLLFPEGTRGASEGELKEALGGVGFLAQKTNVPVIPVFVHGTDLALPKGSRTMKRSRVSVYFGRPLDVQRGLPYQSFAQKIMEQIRQLASAAS